MTGGGSYVQNFIWNFQIQMIGGNGKLYKNIKKIIIIFKMGRDTFFL